MAALLEKYRKVAGTGPSSTINLDDWNGLIDELSTTLAGLVKKGADFDAVATVAIGVLLDRINNVLGPAYDQVSARGAQIEALYAQISGTGISADSVIESATRLFLTDARRAAILAELRGGVPSDGDTLMELYTAIQGALAAIQAIPGDQIRYAVVQSLSPAQRKTARANLGVSWGTGYLANAVTLQAGNAGCEYLASASAVITLPDISTLADGDFFLFVGWDGGGASATIKVPSGSSTKIDLNGAQVSSMLLRSGGQTARLSVWQGAWMVSAYAAPFGTTLSVNDAQAFTDAQKLQLLANADIALPYCGGRLAYDANFQIALRVAAGNKIFINGNYRTIPAGGITASNAGLSASTLYYVFAYWDAGAQSIKLAIGIGAPAADPLYGHKVVNNQGSDAANRVFTFIGAVYTDANGKFADSPSQRWVVSQYGAQRKEMYGSEVSGSVGTSNVEVNSGGRISWLSLGDQAVDIGVVGQMVPSTFDNCYSNLQLDGGGIGRILTVTLGGSGAGANISQRISRTPAAGLHYASLAARTGGSSASVTYQMEGAIHG